MCICQLDAARCMGSEPGPSQGSALPPPVGFFFLSLNWYPRITVKKMPPPRQAGAAKLKTRQTLLVQMQQQRPSEARIELERERLRLPARQGGARISQC